MKHRRRLHVPLRILRAVSCSLTVHVLAFSALHGTPSVQTRSVTAPAALLVAWTEPESPRPVSTPVAVDEPAWIPSLLEPLPAVEPPVIDPPVVERMFTEPPAEPDADAAPQSPYWDDVRREVARALRWPVGWRARTNVEVRILAVRDGLLPLAPGPDTLDAIHTAVRRAVERAVRRAERPPEDVVGRDMRLTIRFEPET